MNKTDRVHTYFLAVRRIAPDLHPLKQIELRDLIDKYSREAYWEGYKNGLGVMGYKINRRWSILARLLFKKHEPRQYKKMPSWHQRR